MMPMDRGSKCGSNQVLRSHLNSERRHLPPLVQWYKVQCHPWKWINSRTWYNVQCKTRRYNAILGYGSSVDPGDGGSSTIQNSKSRISIYRRGTLSTHIVPPRCTLSRPSSITSLYNPAHDLGIDSNLVSLADVVKAPIHPTCFRTPASQCIGSHHGDLQIIK